MTEQNDPANDKNLVSGEPVFDLLEDELIVSVLDQAVWKCLVDAESSLKEEDWAPNREGSTLWSDDD